LQTGRIIAIPADIGSGFAKIGFQPLTLFGIQRRIGASPKPVLHDEISAIRGDGVFDKRVFLLNLAALNCANLGDGATQCVCIGIVTANPTGKTAMPTPQNYDEAIMRHCCDRANTAFEKADEAGIAACIVKDGTIIADGANTVESDCDATRHAEINAIAAAGKKLGTSDLAGCVLYSSLQPCEMCLAAARFAGIAEIYFSAEKAHVAGKYFMFPKIEISDFIAACKLPLTVHGGFLQDTVLHMYEDGDA